MTPEQLQHHHDVLNRFIEAIATGEPVPNDLATEAWLSWTAIDAEVAAVMFGMDQAIDTLKHDLERLHFQQLPFQGTA